MKRFRTFIIIFVLCLDVFKELKWVSALNITVLHLNDIHARIEQTNKYTGFCTKDDADADKCYGGIARLATAIKDVRNKDKNVILLNAGDIFQGTVWYSEFKWRPMAKFTNILNITAASLGNHEFDDGIAGLRPFVQSTNYPILCANCDFQDYPDLDENGKGKRLERKIKSYEIITIDKTIKIGIIGYLTTDTPAIADTENVRFIDEVDALRKVAKTLQENGIELIIALGHSGFKIDQRIAREVDGVDLVVGGHSNTFLYTGTPPSNERPEGLYPFIVRNKNGQDVPVVSAYKYSKYLGYLKLQVKDNKLIPMDESNPILMDKTYKQDDYVLKQIEPLKKELEKKVNTMIGSTNVLLNNNQDASRNRETNFGNFISDSFLHEYKINKEKYEVIPTIALVNGGGIRGSIMKGKIRVRNLLSVLPFGNNLVVVTLKGKEIKEMLELSAYKLNECGVGNFGGFLQVSGMKLTIDLSKPKANGRIKNVMVWNSFETKESSKEMSNDESYNVVMYDFIAYGGNNYPDVRKKKYKIRQGPLDIDAAEQYIRLKSPIDIREEGRIEIIKSPKCQKGVNLNIKAENDSDEHNEGSGKEITIKIEEGDDDSDENDDDESNEDTNDNHSDENGEKDDNDGDDDNTEENNKSSIDASVGSRNGKSFNKSENDRKNESTVSTAEFEMPLGIMIIVVIVVIIGVFIYWRRQQKAYEIGNSEENLEDEKELKKMDV